MSVNRGAARRSHTYVATEAGPRPTHHRAHQSQRLSRALSLAGAAAREAAHRRCPRSDPHRHQLHDAAARQGVLHAPLAHARGRVRVRAGGRVGVADRPGRAAAHGRHVRRFPGGRAGRPSAHQSQRRRCGIPRDQQPRRRRRRALRGCRCGSALQPATRSGPLHAPRRYADSEVRRGAGAGPGGPAFPARGTRRAPPRRPSAAAASCSPARAPPSRSRNTCACGTCARFRP